MLVRAGLLLLIAATGLIIASMPGFAAGTGDQCSTSGEEYLNADKRDERRVMDAARRVVDSCDAFGMARLVEHFHKIGRDGLARAVADACVSLYPREIVCWTEKAAQHVHQRQPKEAEDAYRQALTLENDP